MSPDALKKRVVDEFKSTGLLKSLDVDTSDFRELPRLFEVGHLSMRLVLDEINTVAAANSIAAKIKGDLERQGIELEYEIRPQWKVAGVRSDPLPAGVEPGAMPSEHFHVEVASGNVRRAVVIHVTVAARAFVARHLLHVPPGDRQSALYQLLETCINRKLSGPDDYWNPVLYPSRNIELQDVTGIVENWVDSRQPELVPGF